MLGDACAIEMGSSTAADASDNVIKEMKLEAAYAGGVVRAQDEDC